MALRDAVGGEGREAGLFARLSPSTRHSAGMAMLLWGGTKMGAGAVAPLPGTTSIWLRSLPPNAHFRLHHDLINEGSEPW